MCIHIPLTTPSLPAGPGARRRANINKRYETTQHETMQLYKTNNTHELNICDIQLNNMRRYNCTEEHKPTSINNIQLNNMRQCNYTKRSKPTSINKQQGINKLSTIKQYYE